MRRASVGDAEVLEADTEPREADAGLERLTLGQRG